MRQRLPLRLYAEALITLIAGSVAIRLLPFRRVARWATARRGAAVPGGERVVAEVRHVTLAWSRRVPWRAQCMEQAVTAAHLLSRRGVRVTIHYGAAMRGPELEGHVWVTCAERDVVGCENALGFALLSQISHGSSS